MRLIVGLGNPGSQYADTRHNAGYWFVDRLALLHNATFRTDSKFHGLSCRIQVSGEECWLLKPSTYMNRSGQSVSAMANYYKIRVGQILVVHDELDLPCGAVRLKLGGGHAGHNGLRDIMSALAARDFWRLRIGIDHPGSARQVSDYVLSRPSREDGQKIEESIERAAKLLPLMVAGESQKVMNQLHAVS